MNKVPWGVKIIASIMFLSGLYYLYTAGRLVYSHSALLQIFPAPYFYFLVGYTSFIGILNFGLAFFIFLMKKWAVWVYSVFAAIEIIATIYGIFTSGLKNNSNDIISSGIMILVMTYLWSLKNRLV